MREGARGQQKAIEGIEGREGKEGLGQRAFSFFSAFSRLLAPFDAFLIPLVLALASLLLYLRTLAPDVVDADGGEFQFAAWNFSFVHPTGYPLYLILGGLFQHLVPFGNSAYRLNLFTALTAALAVAAFYLAAREFTQQRVAALMAAASFAVTRTFWYDASAAETYDLNVFFIALLILIALRWQAQPSAKTVTAFCFVYGLALTHHRTIILWLPAFLVFFLLSRRFRISDYATRILRLRCAPLRTHHVSRITHYALRFTFFFLLPLSLYLYIPLRAPASPYAALSLVPGRDIVLYDNSLNGLVNYLLGRVFQTEIGWDTASIARLVAVPQMLLDQFGVVGIVLGIVGFVAMAWRTEWARLVLLTTGFGATILFAAVYHIGDIFHYYIPAYLVWAMWIALGLSTIISAVNRRQSTVDSQLSTVNRHWVSACCLLLAACLIIPQFIVNLPYADRSGETMVREQWTRILSAPIPQNAILISNDRDEMMPLWYIQYVENTRRDVLGLFPLITPAPQYADVARLTDSVLDAGRPVYFIKAMPGIEIKYRLETVGPLVHVLGKATEATPQNSSSAVLGGRVRVLGYDVERDAIKLRVVLYFQSLEKLNSNYTVSVQLFGGRGGKIAQGNDHPVGGEFYPTSLWDVGETLRDEFTLELPADLAPSTYHLFVGMYRQPDGEMLGEPVEMGTIKFP